MKQESTVVYSRLPTPIYDRLVQESQSERRKRSQMAAILIEEALDARNAQRKEDEDA
jgi:hypothetical protein